MPPRRTRKAAAKPAVEVIEDDTFEDVEDDELEDADDDLEELEDEDEEPAPKAKKGRATKAAASKATSKAASADKTAAAKRPPSSGFDANWLATHVNETIEPDTELTSRDIRMVLRRLAKDGVLEREVGTDRTRYDFPKGANDPIVKAVVKHIRSGALKAEKKAQLDAVKAKGAARKAKAEVPPVETEAPAKRRRKTKQDA